MNDNYINLSPPGLGVPSCGIASSGEVISWKKPNNDNENNNDYNNYLSNSDDLSPSMGASDAAYASAVSQISSTFLVISDEEEKRE